MTAIYFWTIKPTGGRVTGYIIAASLTAAMPATALLYNFEAFYPDNSNLISVYFFHYPSGEVIRNVQKSLQYDIINEKGYKEALRVLENR